MAKKIISKVTLCLAILIFLLAVGPTISRSEVASLTLKPEVINVGPRFQGTEVEIVGTAPAGSDIYLKIVSPPRKEKLNKKGKVGFLWMNVAQAEIDNVPKMYLVYSSAPFQRLSPSLQEELGIDPFKAVSSQAKIIEKSAGKSQILTAEEGKEYLQALIGMYQKRGLYVTRERAINIRNEGNLATFTLNLFLPAEVAHGTSNVTAYAVKDGNVVAESRGTLKVQPVGIVGLVRRLAKMDGPLYGTLAVLIALFSGVLIDFIFSTLEKLWRRSAGSGKSAPQSDDFLLETH